MSGRPGTGRAGPAGGHADWPARAAVDAPRVEPIAGAAGAGSDRGRARNARDARRNLWCSSAAAAGTTTPAPRCAAFAEAYRLPVACAFRHQDLFDNRHPNYAGDVGIGVNPKLAARVRDADVLLVIGERLGEITTGGYTLLDVARSPRRR